MALIGVRELREKTSEVLRKVREEQAEYIITYQGHPVALLVPVDTEAVEAALARASKRAGGNAWESYNRLAEEMRRAWPADKSTEEVINEIRRA